MDDSEGKSSTDGVPKWQLNAPADNVDNAAADASQSQQNSDTDKLEVARRFLDDDAVKTAPRDTKIDFLKSKGVEDEDIEHLLGGLEEAPSSAKDSTPSDVCKHIPISALHLPIRLTPDRSPTRKHCKCSKNHLHRNHNHPPLPNRRNPSSQAAIGLP